jgi:ABC-type glycerol-3-phosphate transport system permease component
MNTKKFGSGKKDSNDVYARNKSVVVVSRIFTFLFAVTILFPLVFIILVSFKDNQEFYSNIWGLPKIWRLSNYSYAWNTGNIGKYTLNSIIVSLSAVLASVVLSAFAGYALSKMHIPKAKSIISILMGFNFIPSVAVFIPLYMQLINMKLNKTLLMLILPYTVWQIPFSIYIFKNFYDSIPKQLLDAARVDGSNEVGTFIRIILPIGRPAVATVMVFNFINIWGEYIWASIASSSSTKIQTLPVGLLYFRGEYGIQWGPFAAAIIIIILPLMLIFIYLQRYFIQGLTAGAVKG